MNDYKADPDKPDEWAPIDLDLEEYGEDDIKELWLNLFFWVCRYRIEWLQEALDRKRESLKYVVVNGGWFKIKKDGAE